MPSSGASRQALHPLVSKVQVPVQARTPPPGKPCVIHVSPARSPPSQASVASFTPSLSHIGATHCPLASQVPPTGGLQAAPSILSSQTEATPASHAVSNELSLALQFPVTLLSFMDDPSAQTVDSFLPEHSIHFPWLKSHFPFFVLEARHMKIGTC